MTRAAAGGPGPFCFVDSSGGLHALSVGTSRPWWATEEDLVPVVLGAAAGLLLGAALELPTRARAFDALALARVGIHLLARPAKHAPLGRPSGPLGADLCARRARAPSRPRRTVERAALVVRPTWAPVLLAPPRLGSAGSDEREPPSHRRGADHLERLAAGGRSRERPRELVEAIAAHVSSFLPSPIRGDRGWGPSS